MSKTRIPEGGLSAWGKGMEELGVEDMAMVDALKAPKTVGQKFLESFHLPRYERATLPLKDFLEDPEKFISKDANRKWFVLLELKKGGQKFRDTSLKSSEIMDFVNKTISEKSLEKEDYNITISETLPQEYGGNIIVDKDGKLLVEISKGDVTKGESAQGIISEGTHDPEKHGKLLTVRRDEFLNSLKYSWEDGEETNGIPLRETVYKTIMSIPHEGEGRELKFVPGYYEFHLVRKEEGKDLEPMFVDCRQDEILTSLPKDF
jgi:hypothetical protein